MFQKKDTDQRLFDRMINRLKKTAIVLLLIFCMISFLNWLAEGKGTWKPDYPKIDLETIIEKKELTTQDYHTILLQTGLGKEAVDELLSKKTAENLQRVFEQYQNNFFEPKEYETRNIAIIVYEERIRNKNGVPEKGFDVPSLKDGDIIITKATYSVGWRHGHAAIVTDASRGETLEAILLGNPSLIQNISKWKTYPSFILLRLKDDVKGDGKKIAEYTKDHLNGVPYGLLTGILEKDPPEIKKTQCAHLVWYPYMHFGYDIDSDGSWMVTPKDIANSDLFQVVQVYGVNPEEIWQ